MGRGYRMKYDKPQNALKIGIFGAVLTLIGDMLIGAARFPDGANMLEGYFAIALEMPVWRPILGGMIGFLGISLEFFGLMAIYPLIREKMPRGGAFYKLSAYVYLAVAGGAVHLPCGTFMWIYQSVAEVAGVEAGYDIALKYLLYFLIPVAAVFMIFFIGSSIIQFIAFVSGKTPFPKWYCVFNLVMGTILINSLRKLGNTALINGIGTSNKSIGAIVMFTAFLVGWEKYVGKDGSK